MTFRAATAVFAVGFVLHHADHVRRGYGVVDDAVVFGRTVAAMLAAVLFTLVVVGHERAPLAAVGIGTVIAAGLIVVRLVPPFGPPSDHLGAAGTDAVTWVVVLFELAAALWLVGIGFRDLRQRPAYQS